jgi:hypothetical protein
MTKPVLIVGAGPVGMTRPFKLTDHQKRKAIKRREQG